jgi:hypothetical protein
MASFFNMNLFLTLTLLALGYQTASAQLVTESFGTGANAFTMDFVMIGNSGDAVDTTRTPNSAGSVAYNYNLGKYEVSRDMINKANAQGSLGITLQDMTSYGGNGVNRPATGLSWNEAGRYVNWMSTSTGGTAAYKFDGSGNFQLWSAGDAGYNANNQSRNSLAKYWLPSMDEWIKAAYGSPSGIWYKYPTGSDNEPVAVASGTAANTAVYGGQSGPADIDNAGGLSAYGTMAQGGNAWEWIERNNTVSNSWQEHVTGSYWNDISHPPLFVLNLENGEGPFHVYPPYADVDDVGFRVASVPEPSALSLLAIGLGGLAILRRRK